jgi:hypothetical protein
VRCFAKDCPPTPVTDDEFWLFAPVVYSALYSMLLLRCEPGRERKKAGKRASDVKAPFVLRIVVHAAATLRGGVVLSLLLLGQTTFFASWRPARPSLLRQDMVT